MHYKRANKQAREDAMRTNDAIWREYIPASRVDDELDNLEAERQLARAGIRMGAIAAGLLGMWAAACMVSGLVQAGGIGNLVQGFMTAIGG